MPDSRPLSQTELRQVSLAAVFTALAVLLPQVFHLIGLGPVFMPLFLPIALAGLLLRWPYAVTVAVLSPFISFALVGMPPIVPPILPVVLIELLIIASLCSLLFGYLHVPWWLALGLAWIADRLFLFLLVWQIAPLLDINAAFIGWPLLLAGVPGIILQFAVVPAVLRIIRQKYPHYFPKGGIND